MKSLKQFIVVTTFAAVACTGLRAQSVDLQAAIPFDFHAGDKLMPAGEYAIQGQGAVVFLRGADNGSPALALITIGAEGRDASGHARLEFNRYGNEYFLTAVWDSHTLAWRQLLPTPRQKELAKRGNVPAETTVALVSAK
jgi:hypothetical protein